MTLGARTAWLRFTDQSHLVSGYAIGLGFGAPTSTVHLTPTLPWAVSADAWLYLTYVVLCVRAQPHHTVLLGGGGHLTWRKGTLWECEGTIGWPGSHLIASQSLSQSHGKAHTMYLTIKKIKPNPEPERHRWVACRPCLFSVTVIAMGWAIQGPLAQTPPCSLQLWHGCLVNHPQVRGRALARWRDFWSPVSGSPGAAALIQSWAKTATSAPPAWLCPSRNLHLWGVIRHPSFLYSGMYNPHPCHVPHDRKMDASTWQFRELQIVHVPGYQMVTLKLLNLISSIYSLAGFAPLLFKFLWLIINWYNYFPGSLIFISSSAP